MFSKNNTNFYKDQIYLIISILICTFIKIIVLFLFYTVVTTKDIEELHESKFNNITLNSTLFNKSTHIFHTFCDSKIYNIPIHLYLPFINDAYYYNYKRRVLYNPHSLETQCCLMKSNYKKHNHQVYPH